MPPPPPGGSTPAESIHAAQRGLRSDTTTSLGARSSKQRARSISSPGGRTLRDPNINIVGRRGPCEACAYDRAAHRLRERAGGYALTLDRHCGSIHDGPQQRHNWLGAYDEEERGFFPRIEYSHHRAQNGRWADARFTHGRQLYWNDTIARAFEAPTIRVTTPSRARCAGGRR